MTNAIDRLYQIHNPYSSLTVEDEHLFSSAMAECDDWHCKYNSIYKQLWQQGERPCLPVALFKHEDLATKVEGIEGTWLTSSGTGAKGKTPVFFDHISLQRIERAMTQMFIHHGLVDMQPARFLLLSPDPRQSTTPGYATTFLKFTACAPVQDCVFAVNNSGELQTDFAWQTLQTWAKDPAPIFIFGLTLYFEQLSLYNITPVTFSGSIRGLTGGGWKGMTKQLDRSEITTRLRDLMQTPHLDIRDLFGLTEHPLHYISCKEGHFHIPKYSRFQIVDSEYKAVEAGQSGLIRLLNPFFASLPSHDLLTEDQGTWGTDCPCGEPLPYLRFLGRITTPSNICAAHAQSAG